MLESVLLHVGKFVTKEASLKVKDQNGVSKKIYVNVYIGITHIQVHAYVWTIAHMFKTSKLFKVCKVFISWHDFKFCYSHVCLILRDS